MQFLKFALAAVSFGSAIAAPAARPVARDDAVGGVVNTVTSLVDIQGLVGTVSSVKDVVQGELDNISKLIHSQPAAAAPANPQCRQDRQWQPHCC